MTPTRWDSGYADQVREVLLARVADRSATPEQRSTFMERRNTLRLAVAFSIALTIVIPASIFALAAASRQATTAGPQPITAAVEEGAPLPGRALIGLWKVRTEGENNTWVEVVPGGFTIERDGYIIGGSFSTADDRLATSVPIWAGGADPDVPWFLRARTFEVRGDDRALLAADGSTLAVLQPVAAAPIPKSGQRDALAVPTLSPSGLAELSVPALPPGYERQLTENDLLGTWVAGREAGRKTPPSVRFDADGTQLASDGCNGVQGGWNIASGNQLLVTTGINGQVGCGNALDVPEWVSQTRSVSVDGTTLTLFDGSGKALGTLHRS